MGGISYCVRNPTWAVGIALACLTSCRMNEATQTVSTTGADAAPAADAPSGESLADVGAGGGFADVDGGAKEAGIATPISISDGGLAATDMVAPNPAGDAQTTPEATPEYFFLWANPQCLDVPMQNFVAGQPIHTFDCIGAISEEFALDGQGLLHSAQFDLCVSEPPDGARDGADLQLAPCGVASKWTFADGLLKLVSQPLCATSRQGAMTGREAPIVLAPCGGLVTNQRWARSPKGSDVYNVDYLPQTSSSSVAARCSPLITFDSTHAAGANAPWLARVTTETAAIDALRSVFGDICGLLYRGADEAPDVRLVNLVFVQQIAYPAYVSGTGSATAKLLVINLDSFASEATFTPVVTTWKHEGTHVWQWSAAQGLGNDSTVWEIEGFADFVRFRLGGFTYGDRNHGGSYTDGYRSTGFFFDWIDRQWPDSIRRFNLELGVSQRTKTEWPPDWFGRNTGKSVDALWAAYQTSF